MSGLPMRPSEEQLHAYVDGFLDDPQRVAVEAFLQDNPGEALRLEAYQQQNAALRALRSLPDARPFTIPLFAPRLAWRKLALQAAAAVVLLALGASSGWWLHARLQPADPLWMRLVRQAERAYLTYVPEKTHPVEVTSEQEPHLRTWLSKKLGQPITIPVLKRAGYDLVGGRLLPSNAGPAALFMYQDMQGSRLTLYMLAAPSQRADGDVRYVQSGSLWICYWIGQNMEFALTGELDRERLMGLAKSISMQLNGVQSGGADSW